MSKHRTKISKQIQHPTTVESIGHGNLIDDLFMLRDPSPVLRSHYSVHLSEESSGFGSTRNESSCTEDSSSDESENDVDPNAEHYFEIPGECALDMFIDPLNPSGKAAHPTLQSKIKTLQQKEELLKKRRFSQHLLEKENKKRTMMLERLTKKLETLKMSKETAKEKYYNLTKKLDNLHVREQKYFASLEKWTTKMEQEYKEQSEVGSILEQECAELRLQLSTQQKERMSTMKEKIQPIIIRDGPSQKTNYKIQAKYLQYEIYPLTQRFKMLSMRAEHEESRRRNVEREVSQLREKISELNIKVVSASKGVSVSKMMNKKIKEHKMRWKRLLSNEKMVEQACEKS